MMKTFKSITAPSILAPAVLCFIICGTAYPSLLTIDPRAHKPLDASISVRPNELFTIDLCAKPLSTLTRQHQALLCPPEILRSCERLTGYIQTSALPSYRHVSQPLPIKQRFRRQVGIYRVNFLSMIYNKTLLQAGYICSPSGLSP